METQSSITSAVLHGVEAIRVNVEVAITGGIPGMSIVGMGDTSVQEARERVKSAIRSSGFSMPNEKIVINLAPGSLRKSGSGFDLPIALGILAATSQIDRKLLENRMFVGELSLDGEVRSVVGILAYGISASKLGLGLVSSGSEVVPIHDLEHFGLTRLADLHKRDCFKVVDGAMCHAYAITEAIDDFKDVAGHEVAKRASQIAAAGNHGILLMGPPGSGKSMIASRIVSILPPLEQAEMMEAAAVHSVAGEDTRSILLGKRPFRSPHHSATIAGLVGGGQPVRPGEISLAHCGALFLDELPEFKPSVLQSLRQPMESGQVSITRAEGKIVFPSRFMFIAAANPCPCGYLGDDAHSCTCTIPQIRSYQSRIGGPLIDRIDIQLDVRRLPPTDVLRTGKGTDSQTLREGVLRARSFASWRRSRASNADGGQFSGRLSKSLNMGDTKIMYKPEKIVSSCCLSEEERKFIVSMAEAYSLSGRGLISTLKVARTIADLAESERVTVDHLAEALGFRIRNGIGGA